MNAPATPSPILYFSPEMVAELAMGAEHPHDVAERYGVSEVEYEHLNSLPWFHELVARKRQDLHENGALFQAKAAMMAETLLTRLFQQSMVAAIPAPLTVEVAKQLTTIGRLNPQPGVPTALAQGSGFAINIQINGVGHDLAAGPSFPTSSPHTAASLDPPPPQADGRGVITLMTEPSPPAPVIEGMAVAASRPPDTQAAAMTLSFQPTLPDPPAYITGLRVPNLDRDCVARPSALTGSAYAQAAASILPPAPQPPANPTQTGIGLPSRSPLG